MKRILISLLSLGALGASGCVVVANAATVNQVAISRSTLNADLTAIADSTGYQCYLHDLSTSDEAAFPPVYGRGESGTFNVEFADYWIDRLVGQQIVSNDAAAANISITPADLSAAHSALVDDITEVLEQGQSQCAGTGAEIVASLPTSFVNREVKVQAEFDALSAAEASAPTPGRLQELYNKYQSQIQTLCVSQIETDSQAEATTLRNEALAGSDFATLADKNSVDTSTNTDGGSVGCLAVTNQSYSAYAQYLSSLSPGQITQPIESTNGSNWFIIRLDSESLPSLSSVEPLLRNVLIRDAQSALSSRTQRQLLTVHVTIDPRYGVWAVSKTTADVFAPESPPSLDVLNPAADDQSASAGIALTTTE